MLKKKIVLCHFVPYFSKGLKYPFLNLLFIRDILKRPYVVEGLDVLVVGAVPAEEAGDPQDCAEFCLGVCADMILKIQSFLISLTCSLRYAA